MSKTINYTIHFYSDWHCGSGLSSGVDKNTLVIKDRNGLPFFPGKTLKGLLREAVEEINGFMPIKKTPDELNAVFGSDDNKQGVCFFSNARLEAKASEEIKKDRLQKYLYRTLVSTAIDEYGIADEHSLRSMEVTVPCDLEGKIMNIPADFTELIEKGLKFIKRLGQNRNRGLGRCTIQSTTIEEGGSV